MWTYHYILYNKICNIMLIWICHHFFEISAMTVSPFVAGVIFTFVYIHCTCTVCGSRGILFTYLYSVFFIKLFFLNYLYCYHQGRAGDMISIRWNWGLFWGWKIWISHDLITLNPEVLRAVPPRFILPTGGQQMFVYWSPSAPQPHTCQKCP